jgi:signal transduction histidine kinase
MSFTILGDPYRLQELIKQLFRNAFDYGGDTVTVRVGLFEDPDGFYVEDDGPGIPANMWQQVREINAGENGTGLVIVDQIVSEHGWALTITDSVNGGARFEITGVIFFENDK